MRYFPVSMQMTCNACRYTHVKSKPYKLIIETFCCEWLRSVSVIVHGEIGEWSTRWRLRNLATWQRSTLVSGHCPDRLLYEITFSYCHAVYRRPPATFVYCDKTTEWRGFLWKIVRCFHFLLDKFVYKTQQKYLNRRDSRVFWVKLRSGNAER